MNFYCFVCNKEFESNTPSKNEYSDPVYGNCWKYIADCPSCGQESVEKKELKPISKKKFSVALTPTTCCGGGNGCCG